MTEIEKIIIIEAPRVKSNQVLSKGISDDINYTRADWVNQIKPIIIKKGSKVNLENCIISQLGVGGEVIELSNRNVSEKHPYTSNYMILEVAYYINNNGTNSVAIPFTTENTYGGITFEDPITIPATIQQKPYTTFQDATKANYGKGRDNYHVFNNTGVMATTNGYTDNPSVMRNRSIDQPIVSAKYCKIKSDYLGPYWIETSHNGYDYNVSILHNFSQATFQLLFNINGYAQQFDYLVVKYGGYINAESTLKFDYKVFNQLYVPGEDLYMKILNDDNTEIALYTMQGNLIYDNGALQLTNPSNEITFDIIVYDFFSMEFEWIEGEKKGMFEKFIAQNSGTKENNSGGNYVVKGMNQSFYLQSFGATAGGQSSTTPYFIGLQNPLNKKQFTKDNVVFLTTWNNYTTTLVGKYDESKKTINFYYPYKNNKFYGTLKVLSGNQTATHTIKMCNWFKHPFKFWIIKI